VEEGTSVILVDKIKAKFRKPNPLLSKPIAALGLELKEEK
jgi:hypothetical protein